MKSYNDICLYNSETCEIYAPSIAKKLRKSRNYIKLRGY